ncbi:MAG: PDZ domain-containing protein, partial [Flammeovirgaceae bacterium]|nr:PDZ domain-containing protein [Flammeovirgaceae bacterium]
MEKYYVDSVNIDTLTDVAIVEMLKKLDPHTVFVPAKESDIVSSHLEDGFDGVGIEFHIFQDTVRIVGLVKDAPAMRAGLKIGDRIIEVDSQSVVGLKQRGNDLLSVLRGKRGTSVKVKILRFPQKELTFTLVRDKIPTRSIEAAFMVDDSTGYIKIERFGETVHDEFRFQVISLKGQGMTRLILDLRDN